MRIIGHGIDFQDLERIGTLGTEVYVSSGAGAIVD